MKHPVINVTNHTSHIVGKISGRSCGVGDLFRNIRRSSRGLSAARPWFVRYLKGTTMNSRMMPAGAPGRCGSSVIKRTTHSGLSSNTAQEHLTNCCPLASYSIISRTSTFANTPHILLVDLFEIYNVHAVRHHDRRPTIRRFQ